MFQSNCVINFHIDKFLKNQSLIGSQSMGTPMQKNIYTWVVTLNTFLLKHFNMSLHIITDEGNPQLHQYLAEKNPSKQHSLSLESYLIKPIQRILKYPLLLQQMRNLTDPRSDEHLHLLGKSHFR